MWLLFDTKEPQQEWYRYHEAGDPCPAFSFFIGTDEKNEQQVS